MRKNKLMFAFFGLIIVGIVLIFASEKSSPYNKMMFSDISSFNKLSSIDEALDISSDEYLNDLIPVESYAALINYKNDDYKIYAYVFESDNDAFDYYKRMTGNEEAQKVKCLYYQKSHYFFGTVYYAYYENCAMRISGQNYISFAGFVNWLTEDFPINIQEVFFDEYGIQLP